MYKKDGCYPGRLGCKFRSKGPCDLSQHWRDADDSDCQGIVSQCKKIISFDEPTSALTDREVDRLLKMIIWNSRTRELRYCISHRLDEVFAMRTRASILRDGTYITTLNMKETSKGRADTRHMVGRDVSAYAVRNNPLCAAGEGGAGKSGTCARAGYLNT